MPPICNGDHAHLQRKNLQKKAHNKMVSKQQTSSSSSEAPRGSSSTSTSRATTTKPGKIKRKFGSTLEGFVDTKSSSNKKLWLVKIPEKLAQEWESQPSGSLLGTVRIEKQPSKKQPTITISTYGATIKEGTLNFTSPPPLYAMKIDQQQQQKYKEALKKKLASQDENEESDEEKLEFIENIKRPCITVHGIVDNMFNFTPKFDESYQSLLRKRKEITDVKPKILVTDDIPKTIVKPVFASDTGKTKTKDKRTRKPEEQLQSELFHLFKKQPYWSLKELIEETEQPESYLKEILGKICDYNKSGFNKSKYELKKEYKAEEEEEKREDEWV